MPFDRTHDFLLVFHCNYISILYRFQILALITPNFNMSCDPEFTPIRQQDISSSSHDWFSIVPSLTSALDPPPAT